jgi:hypothetical protein
VRRREIRVVVAVMSDDGCVEAVDEEKRVDGVRYIVIGSSQPMSQDDATNTTERLRCLARVLAGRGSSARCLHCTASHRMNDESDGRA